MKTQRIETVTIADAGRTIAQAADVYFARDDLGRYRMDRRRARPICLIGPAGIGKTEVVRQVAEEKELAFLSYSITHHTRQSAIGLPRLSERTINGAAVPVTEYTMSEILAEVYRTMEETGKEEGILFLDEFNCASETMRPLMLQLLQNKTFGPHAIPDGWLLVLAGNPPEYNHAVSDLDAVTADRLRMLYVEPDYAVWRDYAGRQCFHPVVLSYLDNHQSDFYVFEKQTDGTALVTARGWEDLSVMLGYLEEMGEEADLALVAQYLQCGRVAREFMSYYRQYRSVIASGEADAILSGLRTEQLEEKWKNASFTSGWALASVLLDRLKSLSAEAVRLDAAAAAAHKVLLEVKEESGRTEQLSHRVDHVENRPARAFLASCVAGADGEEGWNGMKERFQREMLTPRSAAFRRANDAVGHVLTFLDRAFSDENPILEFTLNGITASDPCAAVIAAQGNEVYRRLCHSLLFGDEQRSRSLTRAVRAAG